MRALLGVFLCVAALSSYGVSRIGGGKVSSVVSGFAIEIAENFPNLQQLQNIVVASGPFFAQGGAPTQLFIQVREFSDYYKALATLTRDDSRDYFVSRGFKKIFIQDPCVEAFSFESSTSTGVVATWGAGKGVTMTGPNNFLVREAVLTSIASLQLDPGACSWK